jgi:hypothetical protein
MKTILMGLVLTATTTAFAQTSTTAAPAASTATPATAAGTTSPAQTMTTQLPTVLSKFGGNIIFEASAGVADLKQDNSDAKITSGNAVGITYKISDTLKTEVRHNYEYAIVSDSKQLVNDDGVQEDNYKPADPTIHLNIKTDYSLLGSKPFTWGNRVYVPVSQASRDAHKVGTLRTGGVLNWDMNTKATFDVLAEGRMYFNSSANSDENLGADSILRLNVGPGATYNFDDMLSAYYMIYTDLRTTGHQRGNFTRADKKNEFWQEAGLNISAGIFTINPYYSTFASRGADKESYEGSGSDANSSYNLLVQAVF